MNHWLLKSEPGTFSIDDLAATPRQHHRLGRRAQLSGPQHAAGLDEEGRYRLFLSFELRGPGYRRHRARREGGLSGQDRLRSEGCITTIRRATRSDPRWYVVDVKLVRKLKRLITLDELRKHARKELSDFVVLRRGNRLSVTPVSKAEWEFVLTLE